MVDDREPLGLAEGEGVGRERRRSDGLDRAREEYGTGADFHRDDEAVRGADGAGLAAPHPQHVPVERRHVAQRRDPGLVHAGGAVVELLDVVGVGRRDGGGDDVVDRLVQASGAAVVAQPVARGEVGGRVGELGARRAHPVAEVDDGVAAGVDDGPRALERRERARGGIVVAHVRRPAHLEPPADEVVGAVVEPQREVALPLAVRRHQDRVARLVERAGRLGGDAVIVAVVEDEGVLLGVVDERDRRARGREADDAAPVDRVRECAERVPVGRVDALARHER